MAVTTEFDLDVEQLVQVVRTTKHWRRMYVRDLTDWARRHSRSTEASADPEAYARALVAAAMLSGRLRQREDGSLAATPHDSIRLAIDPAVPKDHVYVYDAGTLERALAGAKFK